MRNILMSFAVIAGLGAGLAGANAAPVHPAVLAGSPATSAGLVQTVQYYGYGPHHPDWHRHAGWHHRYWVRHHHWHHWHRPYGFYR